MFAYRRKKSSKIFKISAKASLDAVKAGRRSLRSSWRAWLGGAAAFLILAGILYLVFWSPFLKIKKWSVEGVNFTATAQAQELVGQMLQEKIWKIIPGDSLAVFSGYKAKQRILTAFPEAQAVEIDSDILKGIKITIKGRQPAAFWCRSLASFVFVDGQATTTEISNALPLSEGCYFLDSEGWLFREAPEIFGTSLPTFYGQSDEDFSLGEKTMASSTILFAGQLKKQLREIDIEAQGFVVGAAGGQDIAVFTNESWLGYFNNNRPAQSQVKTLGSLLISDEIKDKRASLKYIDLRLGNRVYYK